MKVRIVLSVIFVALSLFVNNMTVKVLFPIRAMDIGVRQLEDDVAPFAEIQTFALSKSIFALVLVCSLVTALVLLWYKPIIKNTKGK